MSYQRFFAFLMLLSLTTSGCGGCNSNERVPDEVIARGAYGSPTMFINGDDMYFGNDRLPLVAGPTAGGAG